MRLKQPTFYKRFGVRKREELTRPRLFGIENFELPIPSIMHFVPRDTVTIGPTAEDPLVSTFDTRVFIEHVTELKSKIGGPRRTAASPQLIENDFRRTTRGFKPLRKDDALTINPRNGLVVNYGMLTPLYRYIVSFQKGYYEWRNVEETLWKKVGEIHQRFGWNQYIPIDLPDTIPSREQFMRLEASRTERSLSFFASKEALSLFDLWQWVGEERASSAIHQMVEESGVEETDILSNINLLFNVNGYFFVLNLGNLNSWRKSEDNPSGVAPSMLQMRLSVLFHGLRDVLEGVTDPKDIEGSDEGENDTEGHSGVKWNDDDFLPEYPIMRVPEPVSPPEPPEPLVVDVSEDNVKRNATPAKNVTEETQYTHRIEAEVENLDKLGLITPKVKERAVKQARRFTELKDPFGSGKTISEAMRVKPEDYALAKSRPLPDRETVHDKSMLSSKIKDFHRKYTRELMPKHILQSVMSIQNLGLMVNDYKVETVMDAMNHYQIHTVQVKPIKGRQSTLRFRVPVIDRDGRFISNGKPNRARLQRAD